MTTIKLIPSVVEFDVSLDSASMPSLFSQSLETTIIEEVGRQVAGRIPTHNSVVESVSTTLSENRDFSRKIRDWVLESIDYYEIKRGVLEEIDHAEIASQLMYEENVSENLMRALLNNSRFRNLINTNVSSSIDAGMVSSIIEDKLNTMSTNLANEVAEKVLKIIQTRLTIGSDV